MDYEYCIKWQSMLQQSIIIDTIISIVLSTSSVASNVVNVYIERSEMRGRLTVGHLPLEQGILGSNPSPAASKNWKEVGK